MTITRGNPSSDPTTDLEKARRGTQRSRLRDPAPRHGKPGAVVIGDQPPGDGAQ